MSALWRWTGVCVGRMAGTKAQNAKSTSAFYEVVMTVAFNMDSENIWLAATVWLLQSVSPAVKQTKKKGFQSSLWSIHSLQANQPNKETTNTWKLYICYCSVYFVHVMFAGRKEKRSFKCPLCAILRVSISRHEIYIRKYVFISVPVAMSHKLKPYILYLHRGPPPQSPHVTVPQ